MHIEKVKPDRGEWIATHNATDMRLPQPLHLVVDHTEFDEPAFLRYTAAKTGGIHDQEVSGDLD
jgi:hypothetical protein